MRQQLPLPSLGPPPATELPDPPLWDRLPEADRLAALLALAHLIARMLPTTGRDSHE